ncbi:hypothetical protein J6590_084097 [Homalodisca vitripennis]|nr:hypothetical protein J6590_084097 [Homalodisca vitripennis]
MRSTGQHHDLVQRPASHQQITAWPRLDPSDDITIHHTSQRSAVLSVGHGLSCRRSTDPIPRALAQTHARGLTSDKQSISKVTMKQGMVNRDQNLPQIA